MSEDSSLEGSRGGKIKNLKDFYKKAANAQDPSLLDTGNIDGPAFDSEKYHQKILGEKTLPELIIRNNDLVQEIKSLDNDMQMLVYENYNKFISATDTIRKMKANVEAMEDEMERLSRSVEDISGHSDAINANLSAHRHRIEKLNGVRRLLKKLQFLFELPARMSRAAKLEAFGQAVKYYARSEKVLRQYGQLPSFEAIHEEAEAIAQQLRETLTAKMTGPLTAASEVGECVRLLIDLKEPEGALRTSFLESRRARLAQKLEQFVDGATPMDDDNEQDFSLNPVDERAKQKRMQGFLSEFVETVKIFQGLFLAGPDSDAKSESTRQLTDWAKELFGDYFAVASSQLLEEDYVDKVSDLVKLLQVVYEDTMSVHKVIPDARLADRASDVVERAVKHVVDQAFDGLCSSVAQVVRSVSSFLPPSKDTRSSEAQADVANAIADVVAETLNSVMLMTEQTLEKLNVFVSSQAPFLENYVSICISMVHSHMRRLVLSFLESAQENNSAAASNEGASSDSGSGNATLVLLLARLCLAFDDSVINQLHTLLISYFPLHRAASATSAFKSSELRQESKTVAERLVSRYTELQARKISLMLRKSVDSVNWAKMKEPKDVRLALTLVVESILVVNSELLMIVGPDPNPLQTKPAEKPAWPKRGVTTYSRREIDRLFAQKIQLFTPVSFQHSSLLTAVIRLSLKSLIECVRLQTIGPFGFQQIQVDAHYLRLVLRPFVNDESVLDTLADELITSAADRCPDPQPLDQSVVDQICEARRSKAPGGSSFS